MLDKFYKNKFLFEELVKRDFTKKYKRTILGMGWSLLSPLLNLLIMWLVFSNFFGNNVHHYAIYLFAGQLVFSFFSDATNLGMNSLLGNAPIFTKVDVPKYLFLFSQNISSLINFALTLVIFFVFVAFEGLPFTWKFILLLYPIACLVLFNIGLGLILSALQVFFRDMQYLWGIMTQLIMWMSAIFYTIDKYSQTIQNLFLLNPVYLYARYFRKIVIDSTIPSIGFHLLAAFYALVAFGIGVWIYKKYNHEFLYYV
jgi:ABC-2 type transport system permease protein